MVQCAYFIVALFSYRVVFDLLNVTLLSLVLRLQFVKIITKLPNGQHIPIVTVNSLLSIVTDLQFIFSIVTVIIGIF